MQLHAIVDSPKLFIGYDSKNQWLYAEWKGEHDQESSRAAFGLMLDCLRMWPCQKILNDNSSIARTTAQPALWASWGLDEMRAVGLHFIAWVLPPDPLLRQAAEATVHAIERPLVGTFDDVASAYVWLQQQLPRPASTQHA